MRGFCGEKSCIHAIGMLLIDFKAAHLPKLVYPFRVETRQLTQPIGERGLTSQMRSKALL